LVYLMLQKGITEDKKFNYKAIAEEEGAVHDGWAAVREKINQNGIEVYRVLNSFKDQKFVSYVTEKSEVLLTKSPSRNLGTQLVSEPHKATKGFQLDTNNLKVIFGSIPRGKKNVLARLKNKKQSMNLPKAKDINSRPTKSE